MSGDVLASMVCDRILALRVAYPDVFAQALVQAVAESDDAALIITDELERSGSWRRID